MPQAAARPAEVAPETLTIPGFRIDGVLGTGGMGVVYVAEELSLGRKVAVKTIGGDTTAGSPFHDRFIREARLMASVEDPNVVRVYSFGQAEGRHYLAMEYVEGESLADRLRRLGPLSVEQALRIALQIAFGLRAAAAKGIVHRDVKPGNILIDQRDNVRVADFGLSRSIGGPQASNLSQASQFLGTPHYAAPEQAHGESVDMQTDMYALGAVMFEMLTGHPPFTGSALSVIANHLHEEFPRIRRERGDVPASVQKLIDHLTRKDPAQRPKSWDEVIEEIKRITDAFVPPISAMDYLKMKITPGTLLISIGVSIVMTFAVLLLWMLTMGLIISVAPQWGRDHQLLGIVLGIAVTIAELPLLLAVAQRLRGRRAA